MLIKLLAAILSLAIVALDPPTPPRPAPAPHIREIHGLKVEDPYFWLRERDNPKVIDHLKAENAYFEAMTAHTAPLRKALYDEMLARIQQTDLSVLYREHGYWYYTRTQEGKPYTIYCRREGSMDSAEEVT